MDEFAALEKSLGEWWWRLPLAAGFIFVFYKFLSDTSSNLGEEVKCATCQQCQLGFPQENMVKLRPPGTALCYSCWNKQMYPGGIRDGKWFARYQNNKAISSRQNTKETYAS